VPITITVHGVPAPKGSKAFKGLAKNGRAILVESSKKEKPWAEACKWAALEVNKSMKGPVAIEIIFTMRKPKSAPKNRVTYPDRKPDLSTSWNAACEDALSRQLALSRMTRALSPGRIRKVFPGEHHKGAVRARSGNHADGDHGMSGFESMLPLWSFWLWS
jgi:Holliday junction resolvase RusA-like endonuclease